MPGKKRIEITLAGHIAKLISNKSYVKVPLEISPKDGKITLLEVLNQFSKLYRLDIIKEIRDSGNILMIDGKPVEFGNLSKVEVNNKSKIAIVPFFPGG